MQSGFEPQSSKRICREQDALEGFGEGLHLEVQQFGIAVILIEPAGANTPVAGNLPMAAKVLPAYGDTRHTVARDVERSMRRGLAPDVVAQAVARALADPSPRLRYIVGGPARGCRPSCGWRRKA